MNEVGKVHDHPFIRRGASPDSSRALPCAQEPRPVAEIARRPRTNLAGAGTRQAPKEFKIYRYDPDSGSPPRLDSYEVDLDDCGPMALFAHLAFGLRVVIEDYVHSAAKIPALIAARLGCFALCIAGILATLSVSLAG